MAINFTNVEGFHSACIDMGLEVYGKDEGIKERDPDVERHGLEWFVYVKPETPDERKNRRAAYHLHVCLRFPNHMPPYQVTHILPKSSNWREGEQIELVNLPPDEWAGAVHGMDSQTVNATKLLAEVFLKSKF